jgi:hypothetical protein
MSTATRVRSTEVRVGTNGRFRMTRNHRDLASYPRICTSSALYSPWIERSRTKERSVQRLRWIASSQPSPLKASSDRADLPLNLHPAAIRASADFDPVPFAGGWSFRPVSRWRAGSATGVLERYRGLLTDRTVRPDLVVMWLRRCNRPRLLLRRGRDPCRGGEIGLARHACP